MWRKNTTINDLLQMTLEEVLLGIFNSGNLIDSKSSSMPKEERGERHLATGIQELAACFGCSPATICNLKRDGVLDDAVVSWIGRKIIFDVDKARELADAHQKAKRSSRERE